VSHHTKNESAAKSGAKDLSGMKGGASAGKKGAAQAAKPGPKK